MQTHFNFFRNHKPNFRKDQQIISLLYIFICVKVYPKIVFKISSIEILKLLSLCVVFSVFHSFDAYAFVPEKVFFEEFFVIALI